MSSPVRVALIGCGRISQVAHLPALEKANGVELVTVCDPSEAVVQAVARRYDVADAQTDADVVFADSQVEAVLIATPDRFHFQLAEAALNAGKHVLIEKPLASTAYESRLLVKLIAETGLKLQVGAMKRHDPGIEFTREFVKTKLGEIRSFNAWCRIGTTRPGMEATLFPRVYADPEVRQVEAGFKADREKYLLATHGSHIFDTVRYLLGDVTSVIANHRGYGKDHAWAVLLSLASGAIGTVTITVDVPGDGAEGIQVFGSDGAVTTHTHFPFFRRPSDVFAYSIADGAATVPVLPDSDAFERQIEAFARAIRLDSEPNPNAADGLEAVRLIEAAAESVASGSGVSL